MRGHYLYFIKFGLDLIHPKNLKFLGVSDIFIEGLTSNEDL